MVPGIGSQYKLHLREVPEGFDKSEEAITTPFQLVGKVTLHFYSTPHTNTNG
jgi:hypothetical protein